MNYRYKKDETNYTKSLLFDKLLHYKCIIESYVTHVVFNAVRKHKIIVVYKLLGLTASHQRRNTLFLSSLMWPGALHWTELILQTLFDLPYQCPPWSPLKYRISQQSTR